MNKHPNRSRRIAVRLHQLTLAAVLPLAPLLVQAEDAEAILSRMADFVSSRPSFSVEVRSNYDTFQPSGQKIEFAEERRLTLVRPDRLRVDVEESDGSKHRLIYDGKKLSLTTPGRNVFAQEWKPGTVDDAVRFFVRDLGMRLPLAVLLVSNASEELAKRTREVDYVEKTNLYGVPTHHLAGRTDSVDYQVWVRDGDTPLPMRLVLTYPDAEGQPQFRADFRHWNLSPKIAAADFVFVPPAGAQKIPFAVELPHSVTQAPQPQVDTGAPAQSPTSGEKAGGKK